MTATVTPSPWVILCTRSISRNRRYHWAWRTWSAHATGGAAPTTSSTTAAATTTTAHRGAAAVQKRHRFNTRTVLSLTASSPAQATSDDVDNRQDNRQQVCDALGTISCGHSTSAPTFRRGSGRRRRPSRWMPLGPTGAYCVGKVRETAARGSGELAVEVHAARLHPRLRVHLLPQPADVHLEMQVGAGRI